jgi:hypothetical protein
VLLAARQAAGHGTAPTAHLLPGALQLRPSLGLRLSLQLLLRSSHLGPRLGRSHSCRHRQCRPLRRPALRASLWRRPSLCQAREPAPEVACRDHCILPGHWGGQGRWGGPLARAERPALCLALAAALGLAGRALLG